MKRRKSRKTTGKANRSAMDLQLKRSDQSPTWASRIFGWRSETSLLASGPARGNHSGLIRGAEVGSEAMMRRSGRKRPAASVLAVFSALCAVLLWAGVSSFSRAQLPTGAGSNSTRRTSEGVASGGASATAAGKAQEAPASAARKLTRRPELKTRGGQLAFASFTLLAEYPHDNTAFTQGLCYDGGFLYESTGLFGGKSSVRKVDPETGKVLQSVSLDDKHFGEGMVILGNEIHSLTWRSHVAFTWDLETFEKKKELNFDTKTGQGWGITTDGTSLIVSDGSDYLYFWDPETMEETRRVKVTRQDGRPLMRMNELEMVKGYVFANVWFDDHLYKIDCDTGSVVDSYSFTELYPKALQKIELTSKEAVLNGIAWDPVDDVLYLTGKLWPRVYKVKLHDEDFHGEEDEPQGDTGGESVSNGGKGRRQ